MTLVISILALLVAVFCAYLIIRLNTYIETLESKLKESIHLTQNLKQTLLDILVDKSYLLDDGKVKKDLYQKDIDPMINGIKQNG